MIVLYAKKGLQLLFAPSLPSQGLDHTDFKLLYILLGDIENRICFYVCESFMIHSQMGKLLWVIVRLHK